MKIVDLLLICTHVAACASVIERRQTSDNTAVVDLSVNNGAPKHLASGIIYGEPDQLNQIPDTFY